MIDRKQKDKLIDKCKTDKLTDRWLVIRFRYCRYSVGVISIYAFNHTIDKRFFNKQKY